MAKTVACRKRVSDSQPLLRQGAARSAENANRRGLYLSEMGGPAASGVEECEEFLIETTIWICRLRKAQQREQAPERQASQLEALEAPVHGVQGHFI